VNRRRPELLAPAGDPLALRAALASGADAVYLGLQRFNARGRAERFRGITLEACAAAAHERRARLYVTLNTLLHEDELGPALDLAAEAAAAGADAAIVQDLGLAAALRAELPRLPLHGSTQMSLHQEEQAAAAVERLGLERVILARECSLDEVRRAVERLRPLGAGVEVFVHGALCFAYSGQCLMSNFAGRRSANRGICAQNCRFDYTEAKAPAGPVPAPLPRFERRSAFQLISMKDLAAFDAVAALADAGVASFKIEGRLKGPDYVGEVTRLYRRALDAWEAGRPFSAAEAEQAAGRVYSRGFTNGYLAADVDATMRGDKRTLEGEPDVVVIAADRRAAVLVLEPRPGHALRSGQGYRYAHDRFRGGFRVLAVEPDGRTARVRFGAEATGKRHRKGASGRRRPPPPLPIGLPCHLNDDPELDARVRALVAGVELEAPALPLAIEVSGAAGAPLRARARTADGRTAEAETAVALEPARSRTLGPETLREHLGRLGGSPWRLETLDAAGLAPGVFLGFPALHSLRRALVSALEAASSARPRRAARADAPVRGPRTQPPALAVCVGSLAAAAAAREAGAARVILEGVDSAELDQVVPAPWFRLPPVVHDPREDERRLDAILARAGDAGFVAAHLGQIAGAARRGCPVAADLHLNVTNHRTAAVLAALGVGRVTLSLELDARAAAHVAARTDPALQVEVVVGGAVYSMLTRQPYGLGPRERLLAVSEHGHAYRFEAGPGDLTTLYEARELVGAPALPDLAPSVDAVRLDLAHQPPEAVRAIVAAYRAACAALTPGAVAAARAAHERHAPHGSFPGHLFKGSRTCDADP